MKDMAHRNYSYRKTNKFTNNNNIKPTMCYKQSFKYNIIRQIKLILCKIVIIVFFCFYLLYEYQENRRSIHHIGLFKI